MEINNQFSLIHFINNKKWKPLPEWAGFFFRLGESLPSINVEKMRYTVALALPTRSYAAAFISSGFACTNLLVRPSEDIEHAELIYSLPEGTSVKYFDNGKVKKAIKKEPQEYNGILLLGIQIEGGTIQYIRPENVHKVEVSDRNYEHLPNHQKGRSVIRPSDLLNALLSSKSDEYAYRTRIDGVVVGSENILKEEAQLPLAILSKDEKKEFQGELHDLFRVEGFNPHNVGHRFIMHTSNGDNSTSISPDTLTPDSVVVFDGALGFSKWREMYKNQNSIIVLDHTNTNFSNAVSQINQEHSYRSKTTIKALFPSLPSGVEMMFFMRDL